MYNLTPKEELLNRVQKLQRNMKTINIDGTILTNNVDIYYYSGTMQNLIMFIPVVGEPILFVKKSFERAKAESPFFVVETYSTKSISKSLQDINYSFSKLGIDLDVIPYNIFQRIQKVFSTTQFIDISRIVRYQRSIKSDYEINLLQNSAKVVYEAILEVPKILKPGITELELSSYIEKFVRDKGHIGYIRTRNYNMELVLGMVTSGANAAYPSSFDGPTGGMGISSAMPQSAGNKIIKKDEPIIIDISAALDGYIIDQTRMAVMGTLDKELEYAYQVSLRILKETEQNALPNTSWAEHYQKALEIVKEVGLENNFMGFGKEQAKFLGHGVGLELDELPILANGFSDSLEKGMVIAIEPKFTYPNKGVIGIENTYVVTDKGLKHLSYSSEDIIYL